MSGLKSEVASFSSVGKSSSVGSKNIVEFSTTLETSSPIVFSRRACKPSSFPVLRKDFSSVASTWYMLTSVDEFLNNILIFFLYFSHLALTSVYQLQQQLQLLVGNTSHVEQHTWVLVFNQDASEEVAAGTEHSFVSLKSETL